MSPLDLLADPSPLSQQLKLQIDHVLSKIVRTNHSCQFVRIASELAEFRDAIAGRVDAMDDSTLSDTFRSTVQFTTYDAYFPLLSRFFKKPCRESEVINLFAPGLPDFLAGSSSTSGGASKFFPKYNRLSGAALSSTAESSTCSTTIPKRTTGYLYCLRRDEPLDISDENNLLVKKVYPSFGSVVQQRSFLDLDPVKDEERMDRFVLDHAAPYAAGFIHKWRSFLLIHALFAVSSKSLERMHMAFLNTFVEIMRYLDMEFDMVVDCVANGTIPDLDGIAEVRRHLESNILPDPERAAELRNLGRPSSRPGWCSIAWPNLRSIRAVSSGSFASSIPLAQWFLGPNARIFPGGYVSAEAWIAWPYSPPDLEHYKPQNENIIEFLDISKSNLIMQPWEVELGRHYEVLLTTPEGLWRYRIGDIIEIAGFDPKDGTPIIRFVERRNVAIRFPNFGFSEKELRFAVSSVAASTLGNVVDWTTTVDDRQLPHTLGFFVELANDDSQVSDPALAAERILDILSGLSEDVPNDYVNGKFGKPTFRIVGPGTFSDFRQLKSDENGHSLGQVKVPVVLPKAAYVEWFSNHVVTEL